MKTVIIGGVAAGMSAAAKLKRLDPRHQVVVIERGQEVSYGACGLPYYISGVNGDEDLLRIRKPADFLKTGVDLRLGCEAVGTDLKAGVVYCESRDTGQPFAEQYDHLVVATGADPVRPSWYWPELANVFTLKTIPNANRIKAAAMSGIQRVVVVGGGYIGLEMVESFLRLGLSVEVVEMAERLLPTFDPEFSAIVQDSLAAQGVGIHAGESVTALEGDGSVRAVHTDKGCYEADLVLVAVGVKPNTGFLAESGLNFMKNSAVLTDKLMAASLPGVWAAGDCASVWHRVLQKQVYLPLATNANKQGRYLAGNILGDHRPYETALGTAMMKIGELELGRTGIGEQEAASGGLDCLSVMVEGVDRAPYYPGGSPLRIKLHCRKDNGVVVGAQLIGRSGAALRTDVLAACITAGLTARQVGELDLGYAPPYAMPWDVIHIAANAAEAGLGKLASKASE